MKVIETGKILNFEEFSHFSDTYLETGTCYGGSVQRAILAGYKVIKSVEAHKPFYVKCVETFKDMSNVELFFGKSSDCLPDMFKDVTKPAVIFLDAHPAGPNTAGHEDLIEKGHSKESEFHQDTILTKELQIILNNNPKHVIILDDQNGINPDNQAYMAMILKYNKKYKFYFYDEQAGPNFYKNKSLVCIPA